MGPYYASFTLFDCPFVIHGLDGNFTTLYENIY